MTFRLNWPALKPLCQLYLNRSRLKLEYAPQRMTSEILVRQLLAWRKTSSTLKVKCKTWRTEVGDCKLAGKIWGKRYGFVSGMHHPRDHQRWKLSISSHIWEGPQNGKYLVGKDDSKDNCGKTPELQRSSRKSLISHTRERRFSLTTGASTFFLISVWSSRMLAKLTRQWSKCWEIGKLNTPLNTTPLEVKKCIVSHSKDASTPNENW